ncbi:MAG: hypothetical protein IT550_03915 [Novosphingobium sp.]|jgi:hypothetical protein|nr:hypothetical protein [Novosphingobium sp.]
MMLGLTLVQFTALHVIISLVAIVSGVWAMIAYAAGQLRRPVLTAVFLATTTLTTVTGFLFPIHGMTPAIATGLVSTLVLAVALGARYAAAPSRRAETTYAASATVALYLNVFVLVVQAFQKIPALNALAPGGTEPAFLVAQALTLALHGALGIAAWRQARTVG